MPKNSDPIYNKALFFSGLLHLSLLLLVTFGLPQIWERHRESLPVAATIEILPIGETNVKPKAAAKPERKTPPPPKPKPKTKERPKPKPKVKQEPKPAPDPVPAPKKKEEKKKVEKPKPKKEKPKPKPKEEPKKDLSAILESIEKAASSQPDSTPSNAEEVDEKPTHFDNYNPDKPMAMSEIDAIRQQFVRCWNIPAGARNAHELKVLINIRLTRSGEVVSVELAEGGNRYYSDSFFRAAADSAVRAVRRCSPLKNLPPDKYETWKYIQVNFDPHDLLY